MDEGFLGAKGMEQAVISETSHVTLHYRLTAKDSGVIISTFESHPASVQMGAGHLAAHLENCLKGLILGDRRSFDLSPEEAFGVHNPLLVQTVRRDSLPQDILLTPGEPIHMVSETGVPYAAMLCGLDETFARLDFNHPLAGRQIVFDVEIIGIL